MKALKYYCDEYLKKFASGKRHTANAKRVDIQYFLNFVQKVHSDSDMHLVSLEVLNRSLIEQFIDARLTSGEAPSTVARRLATVRHLCRIISEELEPQFRLTFQSIRGPMVDNVKPKYLIDSEVEVLDSGLSAIKKLGKDFKSQRNYTIVSLLLATGLRADEVRMLRRGQIGTNLDWIYEVRTKGRKFRKVYIPSSLRKDLAEYLDMRRTELLKKYKSLTDKFDSSIPVFLSFKGSNQNDPTSFRLNPKTIWTIVRKAVPYLKLHPHLLRHTFATSLLDSSKDIRLVSQALGHSDVRVTMKYTERNDEDVAEALEKLNDFSEEEEDLQDEIKREP
jgi:site-specific recombinase XerD